MDAEQTFTECLLCTRHIHTNLVNSPVMKYHYLQVGPTSKSYSPQFALPIFLMKVLHLEMFCEQATLLTSFREMMLFAACRKVMNLLLLLYCCFVFRKLGGPPED